MSLAKQVAATARAGGNDAAVALVERGAAAGEAEALALLGHWRLWGLYGPRDLTAGHAAIAAAAKGHVEATLTLSALLATGTGTSRDLSAARACVERVALRSSLARAQLALLDAQPTALSEPATLRTDPWVARIPALLSRRECAYLIARAQPLMAPSTVVDPLSGRHVSNPIRDSDGWAVLPPKEDIAIHAINARIAAATGTDPAQGEPLHLLRYKPGQQYRSHCDALTGLANQRVLTVIVYLNDDYSGGETAFANGPSVKGATSDAVVFANTTPDGRADPRTRHAGLPVREGIKWIATRWIRARPHEHWAGKCRVS